MNIYEILVALFIGAILAIAVETIWKPKPSMTAKTDCPPVRSSGDPVRDFLDNYVG